MLQNRITLSLISGGIAFGLSLVLLRNFPKAAFTGLIGFVSSQASVLITARQEEQRQQARQTELRQHIRSLQRKRSEAYEDLMQLRQEQTRLLASPPAYAATTNNSPINPNPWERSQRRSSTPATLPVSWDLTAPASPPATSPATNPSKVEFQLNGLETRVQSLTDEEQSLQASLHETLTAKQKADLNLTTRKAELNQLQSNITTQSKRKQELATAVEVLEKKQQQLQADLASRQTPAGSKSLQTAIGQMQSQIGSLRDELSVLETQILDRRQEKQQLDQTLTQLRPAANTTNNIASNTSKPIQSFTPVPVPKAPRSPVVSSPANEWASLKKGLQAHEFQALRAIALEANPVPVLKKLAEANLTMPEMLIDAINERALETIGDLILEVGSDAASTIIAQEYREDVAILIATA
jgi:myosin heavy subunit